MMISSLLILSIAAAIVSSGRTPKDCTIGEKWTEKFIRFECFKGQGKVVKGVRAIGCVPTNTENGATIEPGKTFKESHFTYSCTKKGAVVSYQIINCLDSKGDILAVGEKRNMVDGTAWSCFKDKTGAIKLEQVKFQAPPPPRIVVGQCSWNGKTAAVGKTWSQAEELKASVGDVEKIVGKAVVMKCVADGKGGFVGIALGCITSTGVALKHRAYSKVNSDFVQCLIEANGTVYMRIVDADEVACNFKGTKVQSGEAYTTPDGDVLSCLFGALKKIGCEIEGKMYKAGLRYVNGHAYHCYVGAGLKTFDFKNITGCTMPDGSIKPFASVWQNGTEFHRCEYFVKKGKLSISINVYGCAFQIGGQWKIIHGGKIAKNGAELKKCAKVGAVFMMRDLTAVELAAYRKEPKKFAMVFGGAGGSGEGGALELETTEKSGEEPLVVDDALTSDTPTSETTTWQPETTAKVDIRELLTTGRSIESRPTQKPVKPKKPAVYKNAGAPLVTAGDMPKRAPTKVPAQPILPKPAKDAGIIPIIGGLAPALPPLEKEGKPEA